jgi:hypothetical protein
VHGFLRRSVWRSTRRCSASPALSGVIAVLRSTRHFPPGWNIAASSSTDQLSREAMCPGFTFTMNRSTGVARRSA